MVLSFRRLELQSCNRMQARGGLQRLSHFIILQDGTQICR